MGVLGGDKGRESRERVRFWEKKSYIDSLKFGYITCVFIYKRFPSLNPNLKFESNPNSNNFQS